MKGGTAENACPKKSLTRPRQQQLFCFPASAPFVDKRGCENQQVGRGKSSSTFAKYISRNSVMVSVGILESDTRYLVGFIIPNRSLPSVNSRSLVDPKSSRSPIQEAVRVVSPASYRRKNTPGWVRHEAHIRPRGRCFRASFGSVYIQM